MALGRLRPPLARLWDASQPWALPILAGVVGALLAITLLARLDARVGPATLRLSARPAVQGTSRLAVPPFGSVSAHTHHGPFEFRATLDDVDVPALGTLIDRSPASSPVSTSALEGTLRPLERQARHAAVVFLLRIVGLGLLGGAVGVLVFPRRSWVRLARCVAGGALAVVVLVVPSVATFDVSAFRAPRYEGALEYAPTLIGDVRTGLKRLHTLREQMALISSNLNRAYEALSQPSPDLGNGTIRILHISDVHLNPAGFDLAERLANQFEVAAVVDTGDMGTWGLAFEPSVAQRVKDFHLPYVFVKGNHDSLATQRAVAKQRNAVVLVGKEVVVGGLRIIGAGDPRFTPNLSVDVPGEQSVVTMGRDLAAAARRASQPPDIAVVHDPAAVVPLDGTVGLVLAGHLHKRQTETMPNGTLLFVQGSTGGAGLRALQSKPPTPLECAVLYFDRATHELQAWDDITLAGLGGTGVQIQRHLVPPPRSAGQVAPVPTAGR